MRLAIISGGSKGLGHALCTTCKQRGFEIVEFSRSAPHRFSVKVDFADPAIAVCCISDALKAFSCRMWKEILVFNNAGTIVPSGPVSQKEPKDVICSLNVNFTSGILFLSEVIAQFGQHDCKKTVVNISSGAVENVRSGWSLYCATKAGMAKFIHTVAVEQKRAVHPFTLLNINPGVMDTAMQSAIRELKEDDFPDVALFRRRKECGELHSPQEAASEIIRVVENYRLESGSDINLTF